MIYRVLFPFSESEVTALAFDMLPLTSTNVLRLISLKLNQALFFCCLCLLTGCGSGSPPISMSGFIELVEAANHSSFDRVGQYVDNDGVRRTKVSYTVDGLKQYALLLSSIAKAPAGGRPLLLLNHGFHSDPLSYGQIDGRNARPGAYYWDYAQAYAKRGYMVVIADYRGHSDSEQQVFGLADRLLNWYSFKMHEFYKPAYWYTRDVIGAYFAAVKLDGINPEQVYMVGHSMGGGITQRSILALGNRINAASIWSTSKGHQEVEPYWPSLDVPLLIQHGEGDESTDVVYSTTLAGILEFRGKEHQLVIVDTNEHLFEGKHFDDAIERDINWFSSHR
ncbi:MAG: alpha/beta fold hydrolase [Oceanicoccus sp.]